MRLALLFSALGCGLAACSVGPDFHTPAAPGSAGYGVAASGNVAPEPTVSVAVPIGAAQQFKPGEQVRADWWRLYRSPALDALIERALVASPTVASAAATLRNAQETLQAETSLRGYPKVDASLGANRQRISTAYFGNPNPTTNLFTLYNASVNVSYTFDFNGAISRGLEGVAAQIDYQTFQLEAARLALTSNVITAAVTEASLRAQIAATTDALDAQTRQLELVKKQFGLGGVSRSEVLTQETLVAQSAALLPPLRRQLSQARHQLAMLVGDAPDATLPEFDLASFSLPEELPLSIPSELVRQRPDIRAAEAQWHVASAQLGVATANLYPQLTLSASVGSQSLTQGAMFGPGSMVSSLSGSLLQPIFHAGELQARKRAAQASYEAAQAQYQQTVLVGLQSVADALRALDEDARTLQAQAAVVSSSANTLALSREQFQLRAVSFLVVLDAQRHYQIARVALAQAQSARLSDTAALFQAIGGGWWNRPVADGSIADPAPLPHSAKPLASKAAVGTLDTVAQGLQ